MFPSGTTRDAARVSSIFFLPFYPHVLSHVTAAATFKQSVRISVSLSYQNREKQLISLSFRENRRRVIFLQFNVMIFGKYRSKELRLISQIIMNKSCNFINLI